MMKTTMLMKTLSMCVILHVCSVSGVCVDLDTVTQDGKRMISNVFKMVDSVPLYTCVSECLSISTCKSVSYQRETRTCHLASKDSVGDPGDVHTDQEFLLTDISQWPRSFAGPCADKMCPSGRRCVVDRFKRPGCIVDKTAGCGPAPDVANATKSSTGQYEGAVTHYTCMADFLFCGSSSTHTCSSLGNWEGLSGACKPATWYNPAIPFLEAMPFPMIEGYKVRFEGEPTVYRRVTMTLKTTNLTIQGDARLDSHGKQDTFLLNKKIGGIWYTDMEIPLAFAVGVKFVYEIVRQNGNYEVYINGIYKGYAEDSTPDRHPDKIRVFGDVQMDKITFSPL